MFPGMTMKRRAPPIKVEKGRRRRNFEIYTVKCRFLELATRNKAARSSFITTEQLSPQEILPAPSLPAAHTRTWADSLAFVALPGASPCRSRRCGSHLWLA